MGKREGCVVDGWRAVLTSNFAQSSLSCSSFPFGKIALTSAFEAFMGILDAFITAHSTDTHTHYITTILRRSFKRAIHTHKGRYKGDASFILVVQGDPDDCGSFNNN